MYEHIHESPAEYELSPFEDGSRRSQRATLRVKSHYQQRQEARRTQAEAGISIRIWRKVLNEEDFKRQLRVWQAPHANKAAIRENYRKFTMTIADTKQQEYPRLETFTQDELREELAWKCPAMFEPLGSIKTLGVRRFGGAGRLFLALAFNDEHLDDELKTVKYTICPALRVNDTFTTIHNPHVSLGRITIGEPHTRERVTGEIERQLVHPVIPSHVLLGPAQVDVVPYEQNGHHRP